MKKSKSIIISTIRENRRDRNTSLDVSRTYVNTEISSGGKQKEYSVDKGVEASANTAYSCNQPLCALY